ncbi:hypothetical protein ACFVUF_13995 [Lysinibacillus sp. NPDC058154]|uniref:hypothetical protein n=1 Tax=Lysinibacillus sp. NPDC058154 TaxID=3346358 RepID=UPI0036D918E7
MDIVNLISHLFTLLLGKVRHLFPTKIIICMNWNDQLLLSYCRFFFNRYFSNSVGSFVGDGGGADGDDGLDMLYVLGSNALGSNGGGLDNDGLDSVESDKNGLVQ